MIYVLDELMVRPGRLGEISAQLAARYVPRAESRGLKLVACWSTPPAEPDGEVCSLLVLWSLPDAASFWTQKWSAAADPQVEEFWREAEPALLGRERRYLAAAPFSPLQ